jgi:hypothetical protein
MICLLFALGDRITSYPTRWAVEAFQPLSSPILVGPGACVTRYESDLLEKIAVPGRDGNLRCEASTDVFAVCDSCRASSAFEGGEQRKVFQI